MTRAYGEADVLARKGFRKSFVCIPTLINVVLCLHRAADSSCTNTEGGSVGLGDNSRDFFSCEESRCDVFLSELKQHRDLASDGA